MEKAYEISNDLLDKDDQIDTLMRDNTFLSNEIQSLEAELISKESELNEYRLIIREQQNQLTNQRSAVADCKIESEKFKVEHMAKTGIEEISHVLLNQALSENEELKHEVQVMNHESVKLLTENERLQRENNRLSQRLHATITNSNFSVSQKSISFNDKLIKPSVVEHNASTENDPDDTIEGMSSSSAPAAPPRVRRWMNGQSSRGVCEAELEEDRSKAELLRTIRQIKEDKIVWEQYACFLLRNIVEIDINLLYNKERSKDIRVSSSTDSTQEDNWEMFSKSLINYVLKRQPLLLNDFMTKTDVKMNGKDVLI